ncbi:hypothetical protein OHA37_04625 [Streptomyces sp. NBC_00335]|uniref:hypothetical protein n=1 Tax=unclassified Streptomyces TaxID=2593676 RepID=UPI00224D0BE2|nr:MULTISPECIES: hypothetical protein [unclassified Streptomyces]MCX5403166.1 hypothetical protein [Streptomyces sp. NBC_00086]
MKIRTLVDQARRLLTHERRQLAGLALWMTRRTHGVGGPDLAVPYARAQAPTAYALVFLCALDTVGVSILLAPYPVAHWIMLPLDLYTVLLSLGLHATAVTRPHVVGPDGVRIRRGARLDLLIPLDHIASARYDLRFPNANRPEDGVLDVAIAAQTSITIELTHQITHVSLLGRSKKVHTVHFHADDPRTVVSAVTNALQAGR